MSKKLTRRSNVRDPTPRNLRTITLQSPGVVVPAGYMRLLDSPEIGACIDRMVSLIATLPIYLMRNSELGDVRVHDALSRLVDVLPWRYGTRRDWIGWVLTTLLGEGDGNAVCLIRTEGGIPVELLPMPGAALEPINGGLDYRIYWRGSYYDPGDCLHCTLLPDPVAWPRIPGESWGRGGQPRPGLGHQIRVSTQRVQTAADHLCGRGQRPQR